MPPGSAKSTYATVIFPPWYMAQEGAGPVIGASHNVSLANRFSSKVRDMVAQHSAELGYGLNSEAIERWETSHGLEYLAAGVGTGIAGFRASLGVIDDPVASREDADSERMREKAWNWYKDDFTNRLRPDALELIIMTRWHEEDLGGQILAHDDGIPTKVLKLPAIAGENDPLGREPGGWLWEGEYKYADRLREKRDAYAATNDMRSWSSMYQQNPTPEEGLFLEVGNIARAETPALSDLRLFGASDYATKDGSGDFTVHAIGGLDKDDVLHVVAVWRRQTTTDVWIEQFIAMNKSYPVVEWGEPKDLIQRSIEPQLEARMSKEGCYVSRVPYPVTKDKPTMARPLQARVAQRKISVPPGAFWADDLMAEMAKFPAGRHDDQVDALALLAVVAAKLGPPKDTTGGSPLAGLGDGGGGSW